MFYVLLNEYNLLAKILILLGFCKYFLDYFLLFYIYKTSTYHLSYLYNLNKRPFCYNKGTLFRNKGIRLLVTKLGIYSQRGNVVFPGWEHFIPKVGIIVALHGNSEPP